MHSPTRTQSLLTAAAVLAIGLLPCPRAIANGFATAAFIQPSDLVAFQGFGGTVAADGNIIAVGTQRAPFAVYVYVGDNGTWTQQARLTSPTGSLTDRFGSSLAIQGNTLVIGAGSASVAYVYELVNGSWIEQAVLAPIGGSGASFGGSSLNSTAISGNTIAVGAPSEPTVLGTTGAVYTFTNANGVWTQEARIVPSDPLVAGFGLTVALQNDTLLIGAPFTQSATISQPGTAFVFKRQSGAWSEQARLDAADPTPFALYGQNVSLDGNTAVIGAQRPDQAEIFVNNNGAWSLQAILQGPDDADYGTSVKIIGDMLLVTAYDDMNRDGVFSGDAFLYTRGGSTWTEQTSLYMSPGIDGIPGPAQVNQRFGNFAAMTKFGSHTIFVLASQTYSNPNLTQCGAIYTAILH